MNLQKVWNIKEEEDILAYLTNHTDYSHKKIKSMIHFQQILVNGKTISLPYQLQIGDQVTLQTEKVYHPPFSILYEDDKFLVVNKESGILTVSNGKGTLTLYQQVYDYLHQKKEKVFIVHRLDKETSGIVLFAKKESVQKVLQEHWNDIIETRKYVALVHGTLKKSGTIQSYLVEDENTFVHSSNRGKLAITHYQVLASNQNYTLLDIQIDTGRKNQIRVHMKENHTPVLGDSKYGKKDSFKRLYLHAYQLSFRYPIDHQIYTFQTEIPSEFLKIVK